MGAVFLANLILCAIGLRSPSYYEVSLDDSREGRILAASKEQADVITGHVLVARALIEKGRQATAARWLQRSLRNLSLRSNFDYAAWVASFVAEYGDSNFAFDLFREIRGAAERPYPLYWRDASDGLASQIIYRQHERLLPEALSVINEAIAEFPNSITLYGTRGGIHFDLGDYEEASLDLKHCNETSSSPLDRGISSAFLAAIASRLGDREAARKYAEAARNLAGDHVVVKRVLASMGPRDTLAPTRA
jgi:tetratricopeptide (TPR) repeat protein